MHNGRRQHDREYRQRGIGQRTEADRADRDPGDQPFGARRIDQRAARHLANERHEAGRGENKADIDLRPFLRGEKDRDERAETGLHVGDEEDEPIEAAQAARAKEPAAARSPSGAGGGGGKLRRHARLPIMTVAKARDGFRRQNTSPALSLIRGSGSSLPSAPRIDDGLALPVFGRGLDLIAGQIEGDPRPGLGRLRKMQRIPIHRDLAAADAEKAAEIDDRGAHLAGPVDEHVDDPAHVLVGALRTSRPRMPSTSCLFRTVTGVT